MKSVFVLLAAWGFSAHALTAECNLAGAKVELTVNVERPDRAPSKEWKFTVDGKGSRSASIRVVDGPRHRKGIDGYEVELRKEASPLAPRTVYSFWTRNCVEEGGELQLYKGAGVGRNNANGPSVPCTCKN